MNIYIDLHVTEMQTSEGSSDGEGCNSSRCFDAVLVHNKQCSSCAEVVILRNHVLWHDGIRRGTSGGPSLNCVPAAFYPLVRGEGKMFDIQERENKLTIEILLCPAIVV
jgi:hypothetical protein